MEFQPICGTLKPSRSGNLLQYPRTLLASLEQRLHADADPEERDLARDHLPDHVFQSVFPQISHRVAEISDARKHNMIRR